MPASGNSRFRGYPARMSERQQLALLLQMTSQETLSTSGTGGHRSDGVNSRSSGLQSHRAGSKNRWTNKNGDLTNNQTTIQNRKDELRTRSMLNGYDSNSGESNESGTINTDVTLPAADGQRSSHDTGNAVPPIEQYEQENKPERNYQWHYYKNQHSPSVNLSDVATTVAEDSGALCEMRRTSPQNKDRSGTGQSGSSPRVTLRLNQVRSSRDDKKSGTGNSRQSVSSATSQMETSMKTTASSASSVSLSSAVSSSVSSPGAALTSSVVVGTGGVTGGTVVSANSTTSETGDVYEFKSSKEATPVRGASSSPNPDKDKEKEKDGAKSSVLGSLAIGSVPSSGIIATASSSEPITTTAGASTIGASTDSHGAVGSPSSKRPYEGDNAEEQEEEIRRKKRKDSEATKDSTKGPGTGRQNVGRNATGTNDKCIKSGKQNAGSGVSVKNSQSAGATSTDRKSPAAITAASGSPKPQNSTTSSATNSKTATPAPPDSDGEDDRPKSSDSSSAPKVPPLKIVIPQSTTSEQEVGARNGKNTSSRSHQLPYVVPSSNSNDSTDKDQGPTASGTTSPTEGGNISKVEDKKDFTGVLHGEERSTHHQRVLRSSHRSGTGGNGSSTTKDGVGAPSGSGNYTNSSPLSGTPSTDRSNNSSPQQLQQQQQPLQIQQQLQQPQQQLQQQQQQQQQRHNSPSPETINADSSKITIAESSTGNSSGNNGSSSGVGSSAGGINATKTSGTVEKTEKNAEGNGKSPKETGEPVEATSSSALTTTTNASSNPPPVELHPRKRKMKPSKEAQQAAATASANESSETTNTGPEVHPHDQPITNCYQLFLNIRKQIERRRKGLFPVQPKPPQGFKDYLMNRCTYVLAGNANKEPNINPPSALQGPMKELYGEQEKERYRLRMQHVVEKEKLVLSVEQEILRVHGRAARALANQSLPFSVCTILKDEEVYNVITPEQEEKDRNARSRYNGRLFLSWLQDVDDKWEKIKEAMLLRHHNEAESLHAVQRMDWEWKLKEVGLCEFKVTPQIEDLHVPMVHVSDDFDLLPA